MHRLVHLKQLAVLLLALGWSATAAAEQTAPADLGFGTRDIAVELQFDALDTPPVDQREALDAAADRVLLFPSAYTPRKGSLTISTHMLALSQLSFAFTDDVQATATVLLPFWASLTDAPLVALSGKITLAESRNHIVSIAPFGQGRVGRTSTNDIGAGAALLVDLMSSNTLVTTLGAVAYANIVRSSEDVTRQCDNRSDYLNDRCAEERTRKTTVFPAMGHVLSLHAGLTWYFHKNWSVRGEAMTGLSAGGSSMGLDEMLQSTPTQGVTLGFPAGSPLTVGGGLHWSNGLFSLQAAAYFVAGGIRYGAGAGGVAVWPILSAGVSL